MAAPGAIGQRAFYGNAELAECSAACDRTRDRRCRVAVSGRRAVLRPEQQLLWPAPEPPAAAARLLLVPAFRQSWRRRQRRRWRPIQSVLSAGAAAGRILQGA